MWRCLKWTNKNARSKLFWKWTLYVKIHLVSWYSESKAAFRIETIMRHSHMLHCPRWKYLRVVSCLTSAVLQRQYEKEERMSVWSPVHRTNAIKYALHSAIQNARECTRHICLCRQRNSRGGTDEENNRRLGLLDCWPSNNFCNFCMQIFDHINSKEHAAGVNI